MPGKPRKRKRRIWPWIVVPLVLIIVAVGVAAFTLYQQAMDVRDSLQQAKSKIAAVMPIIESGDTSQLDQVSADVLALTTHADEIVNNPLWTFAAQVPLVGANISAVSETTQATHILVRDAMPVALQLLSTLDLKNLKLDGGGFNLDPLRAAGPMLPAINAAFADAKSHIDTIDTDAILPFVNENISQLVDIVDQATPALAVVEKYLPTILTLLGGDGPRDYAVLFQNNAEIRATGGNPGTSAILHVDNGQISMRDDWEVLAFAARGYAGTGLGPIEPAEKADLFESDTLGYVQNYTRFPDFRDTGVAISQLWTESTGTELQGVISIDPVLLSYMLALAGPVTVEGESEQITADNAVQLLLSDAYERFGDDSSASDLYFGKVAAAVFSHVLGGNWDPLAMLEVFQRGISEQRFWLWFPDETTEAMAAEFNATGELASDNTTATQTGIYLNDAAYSKLEYHLTTSMAVTCDVGARTVTTSITMTNSIPDSISSSYTLGGRNSSLGLPRRTMLLDVLFFALPGGAITAQDPQEGDLGWDRTGVYNGREGHSLGVTLAQGETRTISFTSSLPAGELAPLTVRYSPTVRETPVTVAASCGELIPGTTVTE